MFHSKESDFAQVNGFVEIVQKISDDGADEIKYYSNCELDMQYSSRRVSGKVIKLRKTFI